MSIFWRRKSVYLKIILIIAWFIFHFLFFFFIIYSKCYAFKNNITHNWYFYKHMYEKLKIIMLTWWFHLTTFPVIFLALFVLYVKDVLKNLKCASFFYLPGIRKGFVNFKSDQNKAEIKVMLMKEPCYNFWKQLYFLNFCIFFCVA